MLSVILIWSNYTCYDNITHLCFKHSRRKECIMIPAQELLLTFQGRKISFQTLTDEIANNKCGPTVDLSRQALNYIIEEDEVKALADALAVNTTITSLNLYAQNIGSTSLNNKKHRLETHGPKYFAEALKKNKTLTNLNLARNHIGFEGMTFYLLEALRENTTLLSVDLSINPFMRTDEETGYHASWKKAEEIPTRAEEQMARLNAFLDRNRRIKEEGIDLTDAKKVAELNEKIAQKHANSLKWIEHFRRLVFFNPSPAAKLADQTSGVLSKESHLESIDKKNRAEMAGERSPAPALIHQFKLIQSEERAFEISAAKPAAAAAQSIVDQSKDAHDPDLEVVKPKETTRAATIALTQV